MGSTGCAVVTGASAGAGRATARALAAAGFELVIGARRLGRLQELAAEIVVRPRDQATSTAVHRRG